MSAPSRNVQRRTTEQLRSQQLAERSDRIAVESMLRLSPEERLQGLVRAAAFFALARRV